ncbi:hypothetical protein ACIBO2_39805 [Nonomuraea sp. NPDC050022]|uniref:hypothetical protein n=1 Tax=unclassified Nonomuraea TaxID=2593643 RepID=UPI0033E39225
MWMQRRTFLRLSAARAAAAGGMSLLGSWQAIVAQAGALAAPPTAGAAAGGRSTWEARWR